MYPKPIQTLIDAFSKFPTVGPRTASRFVFHLLKASDQEAEELIAAIAELRRNIRLCEFCFNPYEAAAGRKLCEVCRDPARERTLLCVVEKESDLQALERTNQYRGLYFILGGTVGMLSREDLKRIRARELAERLHGSSVKEVIVATNPTTEGEATALYVERLLKPLSVAITRLGRGIPVGGELEYADEETLKSALEGRR